MAPQPQPRRGLSRAVLYALIPAGFLVLVAFMVLSGRDTADTAAEAAARTQDTVPLPIEAAPGTAPEAPGAAPGTVPAQPAN